MSFNTFGFWTTVVSFAITFGQVHKIIPGLSVFKLGFITQTILMVMVPMGMMRTRWGGALSTWRFLFVAAVIICSIFSMSLGSSRKEVVTAFWHMICGYMAFVMFVRGFRELRIIRDLIIVFAMLTSIWVITHGGHGPGILTDENDVAMALIVMLPFSFLSLSSESNKTKRLFAIATFGISLLGIAATLSRGGMVGTLPTLAFLWYKSKRKALSLVALAVLLVLAVIFAPPNLISEFESIKDTDQGTAATRTFFWKLSAEMFMVRPITGVGPGAWNVGVWSGIINTGGAVSNITPHSVYFQLLSEMGLVGVIPWLGMVVTTLIEAFSMGRRKSINRDAQSLLATASKQPLVFASLWADMAFMESMAISIGIALVGFLLSSTFLSVLFYPHFFVIVSLCVALRRCWTTELAVAHVMAKKTADAARARLQGGADGG